MSRPEPEILIHTPAELADTTARALASIKRSEAAMIRRGETVLGNAAKYGATTGAMGKVTHAAKLLCIAFAFIVPNLLFIKFVL